MTYDFPELCVAEYHTYRRRFDVDKGEYVHEVADVVIVTGATAPKPQ